MTVHKLPFFLFIVLSACTTDYRQIPTFSKAGRLNAIIEIPAGTSVKNEMNHESGKIEPDIEEGKVRKIRYLPYPLNYGFIASTQMDKTRGGDGDPIDAIVICESLESGTVMEIIPIGLLIMKDSFELDHKILAIPADEKLRTVEAETFEELTKHYPSITLILNEWFKNYDPKDPKEMGGWKDEKEAVKEIEKWRL